MNIKAVVTSSLIALSVLSGCSSQTSYMPTSAPYPNQMMPQQAYAPMNRMAAPNQMNLQQPGAYPQRVSAPGNLRSMNAPTRVSSQSEMRIQPVLNNEANPVQTSPILSGNFEMGYILVGLKQPSDLGKAKDLATRYNLNIERVITGINTVVYTTKGQEISGLIQKLTQENVFTYVEANNVARNKIQDESEVRSSFFNIFSANYTNDKHYADQYALQMLDAEAAWDLAQGDDVIISVIDSGVEIDHADLKNQVVPGYDAFSDLAGDKAGDASSLNYLMTSYKHGTHVAGIIAAEANNKYSISGIAPKAKIMPVKIFPDLNDYFQTSRQTADDEQVTTSAIMSDAIVWSVDHGADIINMSLIMNYESITVEKAVQYALEHNVVVVVAAGNQRHLDNARNTLAAIDGVIAVGSTNASKAISVFSNSGDYLSVVAPGEDIISTIPALLSNDATKNMSGTSMAAPYVAGVAALLKSRFGAQATPAWIKQRLEETAEDLGTAGWDELYGHGMINAQRALAGN